VTKSHGHVLNALLSFLVIAFVVYFMVVVPMNRIMERARRQTQAGAPPAPTKEEVLLTEIRDLLGQQRA
jgi:large conductance mechanosensitive channel